MSIIGYLVNVSIGCELDKDVQLLLLHVNGVIILAEKHLTTTGTTDTAGSIEGRETARMN